LATGGFGAKVSGVLVHSAITYGIVNVANLDIQPADALRRTQRGTLNLTWTPVPQADIVIEFLTGSS
jgi:hypothetical protein